MEESFVTIFLKRSSQSVENYHEDTIFQIIESFKLKS